PFHPVKRVKIDGRFVNVDEKLVGLVKSMNLAGLRTELCCQGDDKIRAYVAISMCNAFVRTDYSHGVIMLHWDPEDGPGGRAGGHH
ncbi:MAG: hypothetical protein J4F28_09680, partial [Nitrosopumilaceae archaeon]|nr:hypothetical protein [Nitrosopumilaceae archaeon]